MTSTRLPAQARGLDILAGLGGEATIDAISASGLRSQVLHGLALAGMVRCTHDDPSRDLVRYALTPTGRAMAAPTDLETIRAPLVFMRRVSPYDLVIVRGVIQGEVHYQPVTSSGLLKKYSRGSQAPLHTVFAVLFVPYRPCRWSFECPNQATTTVAWRWPDFDQHTDACAQHAAEHQAWAARGGDVNDRQGEAEPWCYCPDDAYLAAGCPDYCPAHGTPEQRGTDMPTRYLLRPVPEVTP